jgi:serine/threonine protein kinase
MVGGYRIDELIGRGGMGMVYRATNVALGRTYALKVLAPELAMDDQFRERFKREMRIAASLNHSHVVGIHYAGEQDGLLFLTMDYVDGTDLREVIRRDEALAPERVVSLLAQVTSALDAAHRKGLVHRDVKPANVLISTEDGDEHAYLTDFGLAKRFDTATALSATGLLVGTVDFMPPEQISGGHTDARTDIYALGCVLFQMLSGKVPYERENTVATLFAHVHDPPPSLVGPLAELHPAFNSVIAKAMAKDPADRYLSAGDLARAAEAALQGIRYTGAPTIVGTGEARPEPDVEDPTVAAETVLQELSSQPQAPGGELEAVDSERGSATKIRSGTESAPATAQPATVARDGGGGRDTTPALGGAAAPAGGAPPQAPDQSSTAVRNGGKPQRLGNRRWPLAAAAVVLVGGAAAAIVALTSGSSPTVPTGERFAAAALPVPTNLVAGTGSATIRLNGNVATVTLDTDGLLNAAPHALHIHAGGQGVCPPASAASLHNGHPSISTHDGIKFYGPPVTSLTTTGDTSPRSIVDFTRYPAVGSIRYTRTISVTPEVAAGIRQSNAVIVVHGIDYNGNGIYDNVLDRSELNSGLTGESTAPALCGPLAVARSTAAQTRGPGYVQSHPAYVASLALSDVPPSAPTPFQYFCHLPSATTEGAPRTSTQPAIAPA